MKILSILAEITATEEENNSIPLKARQRKRVFQQATATKHTHSVKPPALVSPIFGLLSLALVAFCTLAFGQVKNQSPALVNAQPTIAIKLFSRYNYFVPGDQGAVVVAPLDNNIKLGAGQHRLSYKNETLNTHQRRINSGLSLDFDLSSLPLGESQLRYSWQQNHGVVHNREVVITKLPQNDNVVQIDLATGGLRVNGLPFFPYGFYCSACDDLPEREVVRGFNMMGPYQLNFPEGRAARRAYMDRSAALGFKVQYGLNSLVGHGHNGAPGAALSDEARLALLREEVIAFRDHPALLSWYISDEPDGQGRPPEVIEAAYQAVRELDPYHPVSVVFMMPSKIEAFRNSMDIAMTDPYPLPGHPPQKILDTLNAYTQAYRHEKSVWLVPQGFGGQEMWSREPTAKELRQLAYLGLMHGAKGIQYYVRDNANLNPQAVSALSAASDVAVETAQISAFLLSAQIAPPVNVRQSGIIARAFRHGDTLLILAVNTDNLPKSVHLKIAKLGDKPASELSDVAELWFENRSVAFKGGKIKDMIDAYGTRAYLIRSAAPDTSGQISQFNLAPNPSFEQSASPGVPMNSNRTYSDMASKDIGSTAFLDPREHVHGLLSLRLTTASAGGGNRIRLTPIAMSKGQSYQVSIWAKGQRGGEELRFKIDAMQQVHSFTLSNTWREYRFDFDAPQSSTTAILSFELLSQGSAWIDLVQALPNPVLSYRMQQAGPYALVENLSSTHPENTVRYQLDALPNANSPRYQQAVKIEQATTFYASLFDKNQQRVASASVFLPVSKAYGKKVSLKTPLSEAYPAKGATTLTDGLMGGTQFKDGRWLGFSGPDLDAHIDFGKAQKLTSVTGSFLCDPNSGIFLPPVVKVYASNDGKQYREVGSLNNEHGNIRGEPYLVKITVPIELNQPARYLRIVAQGFGKIPQGYLFPGSTSWLFVDEILAN